MLLMVMLLTILFSEQVNCTQIREKRIKVFHNNLYDLLLLNLDWGIFYFYYFQINFVLAIKSKALCSTVAAGESMFLPVSHHKVFIP
jgi:hypothetical protein